MSCAVMYQPCISATDSMQSVLNKPLLHHHHGQSNTIARPLPVPHLTTQQQQHHHHHLNAAGGHQASSQPDPSSAVPLELSQMMQESRQRLLQARGMHEGYRSGEPPAQSPPAENSSVSAQSPKKDLSSSSDSTPQQGGRSPLQGRSTGSSQNLSLTQNQAQNMTHISTPSSSPLVEVAADVKYVSANCVVVTHYRGDASAVVDEHFSRALSAKPANKPFMTKGSPLSSRSFPPSFYQPPSASRHIGGPFTTAHANDFYEAYHGSLHSFQASSGATDPWTYSLTSQAYGHRGVGPDVYHPSMASASHAYQYSPLGFQQTFGRLSSVAVPSQMTKSDNWSSRYYDAFAASAELSSGMDSGYSSAHYSGMAGLEPGMTQECSKDLYWL